MLAVTRDALWDWYLLEVGKRYVSPYWYEHIGYRPDEIAPGPESWRKLLHPEDAARAIETLRRHLDGETASYESEYRLRHKDGHWVWIHSRGRVMERDADGRALRMIGLDRDESAQREAEERLRRRETQLRETRQHEASSLMAGRVAHDFNNLLLVISASAEFLEAATAATDPRREDVINIRSAVDRAAELTRQLLVLGQQQMVELSTFALNEVIRRIQPLLEGIVNAGGAVRCVFDLDPAVGDIRADAGHIEQLLMNLVMNARDAMPAGGVLTVCTRRIETAQGDDQDGDWVQLVVEDTGVGMSDDVLARVFEPFFTTKDKELGTGLGLATVYGIVRGSGGAITLHSAVGEGTRADVRFPAVEMAGVIESR